MPDNWRDRIGLTLSEVQAILAISKTTAWKMTKTGALDSYTVGSRGIRVKAESVARLIDGSAAKEAVAA